MVVALGSFLCGCVVIGTAFPAFGQDHMTWRDYGGAADSAQYSALQQINPPAHRDSGGVVSLEVTSIDLHEVIALDLA